MSFSEISPLEAFDRRDGYRFIDVREEVEFRGPLGCIESAELFPLSDFEDDAESLCSSPSLLLVCRSGKRSGLACQRLIELGCENATNLSGGMIGWNRAGLPVIHTEPEDLTGLVDQVVSWSVQVGPLTRDAALEIVRERFKSHSATYASPNHRAVDELISVLGESLATTNPPDLDISLASFRRSLKAL